MVIFYRIFILTLLAILTGCANRSTILEISDEDIKYFNAIIERPGEEIRFFNSYDKTPLACTIIHSEKQSKGVILFIHGIGARANLYLPLADDLAANGYTIYLLDIRGHGYSQGVQGHMPKGDSMAKDIKYFYEYVVSVEGNKQKYIAMGHSFGTYVWINMLAAYQDIDIDALILISGGSINKLYDDDMKKRERKYFSYINKWKAFYSIFNHNSKPVHIAFPDVPQFKQSGFVQDYGFSFFTMFRDYKNRFKTFYMNTKIPILMIFGSRDELFDAGALEESYNLIESKNKELISLEGKTHTSIIWSAGSHINIWLKGHFQPK